MNTPGGIGKKIGATVFTLAALTLVAYSWKKNMTTVSVEYPYICLQCREFYDISALKRDYPDNWRIAPGGGSDSVVICIRCNKGRAYPAPNCQKCGTFHILHLYPSYDEQGEPACPRCNPKVDQAAKARGINLIPPELNPS